MKSLVVLLIVLAAASAFATSPTPTPSPTPAYMPVTSAVLSPSTHSLGSAFLTDEHGSQIPILGVIQPDVNGHTSLATADLLQIGYSNVTGLKQPVQFKMADGKKIPLAALASIDPSTKMPVPLKTSAAQATYVPADPTAWASPAPTNIAAAADRLAAWIKAQPSPSPAAP